jgi:4-amino-4-deoxy-L-arabinose transferase-like glycosyltransferase
LEKRVIWWISGVLLVACILRIYALVGLPVRRITDDSWEYYSIARNIPAALKGEPIENRQEYLSFAANRGWLYPLFIAGVFKVFSPKVRYVLAIQALLGVVTCLLLYLIGREIFNPSTGILAALLSAIYPGFIFHTPTLYQETTSLFILTLMVYMLCLAVSQKRLVWFCATGALMTLLSLYRSGFILFFLAGIPLFMFVQWRLYQRYFVRYFAFFMLGIILMCALYGTLAYRLGGSIFLKKPTYVWNFYEPIHHDGWLSDIFAPTYSEELEAIARQHDYPLPVVGQALEYPSELYVKAAILFIRTKPLEYVSQLVKRTARMWFYFESYPGRWHSPLVLGQMIFHGSLIILGFLGLGLSLPYWNKTWIFYLTIFYVTAISVPFIGLPRYALPAMPFIIILAAYVCCQIAGVLKVKRARPVLTGLITSMVLFTTAGIFIFYLGTAFLLKIFSRMDPGTGYLITVVLINAIFIILAGFCSRLLNLIYLHPKKILLVVAFPLLLILLMYNNFALVRRTGPAWWTSLTGDSAVVRQVIYLPDDFKAKDYQRAKLMMDLFPKNDSKLNFNIAVNGQRLKVFRGGVKADAGKFEKKLGGLYKSFFFDTYGLKSEELRQWYTVELPLSLLHNVSQVEIELSGSAQTSGGSGQVMVFGDYIKFGTAHLFQGPCFPNYDTDTSMYKVMPYCGDYRFERDTLLSSQKTISEYYRNGAWQESDLSNRPGLQTGAYRIRIELMGKDGSQTIL